MTEKKPVTLIVDFNVEPEKQNQLVESVRQNTETVITSLKGWIATKLVASVDGKRVTIYSQWDSQADVDAMRADPRMQAYHPKVLALATLDATVGTEVMSHHR